MITPPLEWLLKLPTPQERYTIPGSEMWVSELAFKRTDWQDSSNNGRGMCWAYTGCVVWQVHTYIIY